MGDVDRFREQERRLEEQLRGWSKEYPNAQTSVGLADSPSVGEDWRTQTGWGWIFKVWFRTWRQSWQALQALRAEGWEPSFWGRKLRVSIEDGYEGQRLIDFVLARWPDARIQLRND
jgi:hypothetical protein